jgi:uncharacterized protein
MELASQFTVPLSVEDTWEALLDFERVARAMPGAHLDAVEGDEVKGSVTVRLGPMKVGYSGVARIDARDPERRQLTIDAKGDETRGTGSASAVIRTRLIPSEGGTTVDIAADVDITGRPAQMGAGLIQDVAKRLTDEFAQRLRADLMQPESVAAPPSPPNDAATDLDMLRLAGGPVAKRAAIALVAAALVWLMWRRVR